MNPIESPSRREVLGATAAALFAASSVHAADAPVAAAPKRAFKKAIMFDMLQMDGMLIDKFKSLKA